MLMVVMWIRPTFRADDRMAILRVISGEAVLALVRSVHV